MKSSTSLGSRNENVLKSARFITLTGLALGLLIFSMTGCAPLPSERSGVPAGREVGRALLDDWLARSSRNRTLQGVAKVKVQTAERAFSGTQVVLAEAPARLRAEMLSPFGNPMLLLVADGAELSVLLPGDSLLYRGVATPENLGRFTRLPMRLADLVGILLARPPLITYVRMDSWQLPEGGWQIELEAGPRRQVLVFDAARRLTAVRYLTAGEPQLHLDYNNFDHEQFDLPRSIDMLLPQQNTRASLDFSEFDAGRELSPGIFTLQPPEGVSIIMLDELTAPVTGGAEAENSAVEQSTPQPKGSQ